MVRSHRLRCSTGLAAVASAESRYCIATSWTLHLRCSHHYYRASLGRLGFEECLPCRHPCSSVHVGHHLSSPGWPVFSVTPPCCRPRCRKGSHARHMQWEFKAPSGMDVAMLGPSGLNDWTPRPVHVFVTCVRGTDCVTQPRVTKCPTTIAPVVVCAFRCLGKAQPDSPGLEKDG
jgi:hypothetical protein